MMHTWRRTGATALLLWMTLVALRADPGGPVPMPPFSDIRAKLWADSVYASMNVYERIGQLFMIRAHSDKGPEFEDDVAMLVRDYHVGGLCFFQGTARRQAELTNRYQGEARIPLMVSMDAEWGLSMRLKGPGIVDMPRQIALGAIKDDTLIYQYGREVARQLRRLGVQVNFAPVADVNNNPRNPVINFRSFGEDRELVAAKSAAYMRGLQDGHVMACAKHFPGHGDTDADSHYELPQIRHDRRRLDSIELYPFRQLVGQGLQGVMVAHLSIPALDSAENRPTTLSRQTVRGLLREEIGFEGLVFTDAMEMKGVSDHFAPGDAELKALEAGNDILLLPRSVPQAFEQICMAIQEGQYPLAELERSVKRILRAKYSLGLTGPQQVELAGLEDDLSAQPAGRIRARIMEEAVTLVQNKDDLLPFRSPQNLRLASINIGGTLNNPFQKTLAQYAPVELFHTPKEIDSTTAQAWLEQLSGADAVVVGLFYLSPHARNQFGITASTRAFLNELSCRTKVVLVHFGNPYALEYFDDLDWVLLAFSEDAPSQRRAAEALMGHYLVQGKLPVTVSTRAPAGRGLPGDNLLRLGYDPPEHVGMSSDTLAQIDSIMAEMIREKAAPGGQVLVVRHRKVVYEKAFGRQTYAPESPEISPATLYDLASVTKVTATTLAMMKLRDEGQIKLDEDLGLYLPEVRNTNKEWMRLRDILTHHAGLQAWIPFYTETLEEGRPAAAFYDTLAGPGFSIPVAERLWMRDAYRRTLIDRILDSPRKKKGKYVYSDLGFILLKEMIEWHTGRKFDTYVQEEFYQPLGLRTTGYRPLDRFPRERVAPTEEDDYFRHQRVQGHVHDMAAAMFGGVAGHAGLFSNAHDLAVVYQMLLNGGTYGGRRFLRPETIREFTTRCPDCPRRALGFDMKSLDGDNSHVSELVSDRAFGHLGFTGTCVWVDPAHDLIFIFLSNRTYPDMEPNRLQAGRYRQRVQSVVYRALIDQPQP